MTKRRLIRKADEARVLESLRACAAVKCEPHLYWGEGAIHLIEIPVNCGLSATEIVALAAVGIHPGADGWEIEDAAPVVARAEIRHTFACKSAGLPNGDDCECQGVPASPARPPLPPGFGWFQRGVDSYSLDGPNGTIAKAHHDGRSWTWSILSTFVRTTARDLREAQERAEDACRAAGLFDAPAAPDLGAKVDALRDAAGAPPTGAARTLMTLLLRATSLGEMPGTQPTLAERLDAMGRLCEAFVAELRASLPAPRTTDGALTAYLLEHYREAWRPGEDALALAIRLLGAAKTAAGLADGTAALHASRMREVEAERDEARKEAEAADENAKELAAELTRLRATLAREEARRIEAERGRGEALGDLATVRNDVLKTAADLAAKMGAPHG